MAVPFNMPEEQSEVDVIIGQLQALLGKLQVAVRDTAAAAAAAAAAPARVRHPSGSRSRTRESGAAAGSSSSTSPSPSPQSQNPPSPTIPDLVQSLSWLATASQDSSPSTQLTAITRSPRRRTSSESSSCEETKISITAIVKHGSVQDWNQIENAEQQKDYPSEGFLSVLAPSSVSSCSLWTAMICFVGWHIFRAR